MLNFFFGLNFIITELFLRISIIELLYFPESGPSPLIKIIRNIQVDRRQVFFFILLKVVDVYFSKYRIRDLTHLRQL